MIIDNPFSDFKTVIFVKFDCNERAGELPEVNTYYAKEIKNNVIQSTCITHLLIPTLSCQTNTLVVTEDSGCALRCYLSLGWALPSNVIDLAIELKNINNGLERQDNCEPDSSTEFRFQSICHQIDLIYALKRGSYLKTSALLEQNGIPFDVDMLSQIRSNRAELKKAFIAEQDEHNIYESSLFSTERFRSLLNKHDIAWPIENGQLILQKEVFEERAQSHPLLKSLHQLRKYLSKLSDFNLPVGNDGRNRCNLRPFASKTGRNQPSNSNFIFGQSTWLRGLIKPSDGFGVAYIDYAQQEFGIAAALSGDKKMQQAYLTGDPYLAFAKQAGAAPSYATKQTHKAIRDQFKACTLAIQYGMSAASFASIIKQQLVFAERLIELRKSTYGTFWRWSDAVVSHAMTQHKLQTVYDWRINFDSPPNPRFLRNYPMQANGAEMLRLACCMLLSEGIKVCAPVHDAVLIEAPLRELGDTIKRAQQIMTDASSIILDGFTLNTDVDIVRYPDRYQDPRGIELWELVRKKLSTENLEHEQPHINPTKRPAHA